MSKQTLVPPAGPGFGPHAHTNTFHPLPTRPTTCQVAETVAREAGRFLGGAAGTVAGTVDDFMTRRYDQQCDANQQPSWTGNTVILRGSGSFLWRRGSKSYGSSATMTKLPDCEVWLVTQDDNPALIRNWAGDVALDDSVGAKQVAEAALVGDTSARRSGSGIEAFFGTTWRYVQRTKEQVLVGGGQHTFSLYWRPNEKPIAHVSFTVVPGYALVYIIDPRIEESFQVAPEVMPIDDLPIYLKTTMMTAQTVISAPEFEDMPVSS